MGGVAEVGTIMSSNGAAMSIEGRSHLLHQRVKRVIYERTYICEDWLIKKTLKKKKRKKKSKGSTPFFQHIIYEVTHLAETFNDFTIWIVLEHFNIK